MKRVVIIGGGFAGSLCAKKLQNRFDVVLIDTKDYFEFTPSVLRIIIKVEEIKKIQVLHKDYLKKSKIIVGEVKEVSKDFVLVNDEKVKYDYLIVSSGSHYSSPIKQKNIILPNRADSLKDSSYKISKSKNILIVGGGLVGVELAGELCELSNKKIILIHSGRKLLPKNNFKSSFYAEKSLKEKGVEIIFNEKVSQEWKNFCLTKKGKKIDFDLIFFCTGIKPHFEFMKKNFSGNLDSKGYCKVDDFLRLKDFSKENIFIAGDFAKLSEEKTAQNAEKHAKLLVKNIFACESKRDMIRYKKKKIPFAISLGSKKGIFEFKNFVLVGRFPIFLKKFIEWNFMRNLRKH